MRDREVERAVKAMGDLTEAQKATLGAMASAIVNKLLHEPMRKLRSSSVDGRDDLGDAVRELWGMEAPGAGAEGPTADEGAEPACACTRRGEVLACAGEPADRDGDK